MMVEESGSGRNHPRRRPSTLQPAGGRFAGIQEGRLLGRGLYSSGGELVCAFFLTPNAASIDGGTDHVGGPKAVVRPSDTVRAVPGT